MRSDSNAIDRRDALKLTGSAVTISITGLAGCLNSGRNNGSDSGNQTQTKTKTRTETETGTKTTTSSGSGSGTAETIKLGGKVEGWMGRKPKPINGKTNPTLQLESGTKYELTWVNLDGKEHELIIEDGNNEEIVASESSEKKGATVTMQFTAKENMAEYYCEYHPKSMRGTVDTGGSNPSA